jgi:hypothetical protein
LLAACGLLVTLAAALTAVALAGAQTGFQTSQN